MSSRPSRGAARLAAILDALPDALLLVNANGTVVNANSIALEVFETPGTALIGRGLLDLLPAFDSKRIPGSMRRPDEHIEQRQPPTRMVARRTDGSEFPVEVTSANLEDGRTTYASSFEAAYDDHRGYGGNELLMLVVRDLTGTVDTEAELARQQRQTEMILRAAAEGVVGTDTEGRVVLVNPSAAQILGYRASDLGGQELHPLVHHSRADGSPLPYPETPLADTLRSGRKHRVRGQVLWSKKGERVPVDMTTAPVRDGDQLVGAVLTFTDRRATDALQARHTQLLSVVDEALRGPLEELRGQLTSLAADSAGQLWPEANQVLHHLSAGYTRMTTLIDNVVRYQRLDIGRDKLARKQVSLDSVITAGVESAVELIGPGRAQFAVHAPPLQAEVDPDQLALALAHLIADVAGVDVTGNSALGGLNDSTIVVAAARRGGENQGENATRDAVVRIEVRGPHSGGSPVHVPIARGVVRMHGGVLQTHQLPGAAGGSAYVLEVPVGDVTDVVPAADQDDDGADGVGDGGSGGESREGTAEAAPAAESEEVPDGAGRENETTVMPLPEQPRRGTPDARALPAAQHDAPGPVGPTSAGELVPGSQEEADSAPGSGRRARRALHPVEDRPTPTNQPAPPEVRGAPGNADVPQGSGGWPAPGDDSGTHGGGLSGATRDASGEYPAAPAAGQIPQQVQPGTGRRGRRARPQSAEEAAAEQHTMFALPPAAADQRPDGSVAQSAAVDSTGQGTSGSGVPLGQPGEQQASGTLPQQSTASQDRPTGRRRKPSSESAESGPETLARAEALAPADAQAPKPHAPAEQAPQAPEAVRETRQEAQHQHSPQEHGQRQHSPPEQSDSHGGGGAGAGSEPGAPQGGLLPAQDMDPRAAGHSVVARSPILGGSAPPTAEQPRPKSLPMPGHRPEGDHSAGVSVRTLGQGQPYAAQVQAEVEAAERAAAAQGSAPTPPPGQGNAWPQAGQPPHGQTSQTPASGTGRRRKLAAPPQQGERPSLPAGGQPTDGPQPEAGQFHPTQQAGATPQTGNPGLAPHGTLAGGRQPAAARQFTVSAPDTAAAEGPEPLDGPDGAAAVAQPATAAPLRPIDVDDELPPEPLDNPRRLLVWPEPDVTTQEALTSRGYRPVLVHSREEVDAQIAAYPAALFVDPLTGPITRTALQSLRQAAVAAEVPVLVTAGLGQTTREAAYGADPAALLKALAPRDSEQHPPRVLLVEEEETIAQAFAATLERRGMQVAYAPTDGEATMLAEQVRPNLVVMNLAQVRPRRTGVIDWLRVSGLLSRTPFVVYTSADMDPAQLAQLASGETVLFLAERSTSHEVQHQLVDLLAKIGAR